MSVHRRGSGWRVRWRQGDVNRSREFSRKRDAEVFDLEVRRRLQSGGLVDLEAGSETLAQWMEEWWRVYAIPNLKPRTREVYARMWATHLMPRLGSWPLRDITPAVVEDFRAQLHVARVGDPTIIKTLGLLQGMLKRAAVRGRIPANPVLLVDKPRQSAGRRPAPLPPLTVERIRSRLEQRDATLVSVLAYAGLRPDEAIRLRWADVGDQALDVFAHKTSRRRQVRLLAPLTVDLLEWRIATGRPGPTELVFPRARGAWTDSDWRNWRRRAYQAAAADAGVTGDMRPYRLRSSFVSLLLWEGRSLPYVADQAGHAVATLSEHYAGVLEELEDGRRRPAGDVIREARHHVSPQPALFGHGERR